MGLETELVAEDVEIDLPDLKFTYQENSVEHFQEELFKEDGTKLDVILEVMKSKLLQLNTPGFIFLESKPLFKSLLLEKEKENQEEKEEENQEEKEKENQEEKEEENQEEKEEENQEEKEE